MIILTEIHNFLGRPYGSNGRSYVFPLMFSFFFLFFRPQFSELPRPIALKLCHLIGICVYFIMQVQKLGAHSPKKIRWPKTCKISVDFEPLQTFIANISGTAKDIQNRPTVQTMAIPPALLWSTNGLELHVSLDPLKCTFLADSISAHRGCCAPKILHALEIDQALIANARSGTGSPKKFQS